MTTGGAVTVEPLTPDRLADVEALLDANATVRGCSCMWFRLPAKEVTAGWSGGNRERWAEVVRTSATPPGVLAYRDGVPVGWCAVAPRAEYVRTLRSPLFKGRPATPDDDSVWLVTCFFVLPKHRRTGLTRELLDAAVALAAAHGATAVEGFPRAIDAPFSSGSAYVGLEAGFRDCGFEEVTRPNPARVVMRRALP